MKVTAHITETDRAGRIAKAARIAVQLLCCRKAATISEYGLVAVLIVSAAGAVHSPRLHAVKDTPCEMTQAACFHDHPAAAPRTAEARPPAAHRPAPRPAAADGRHGQAAAGPARPNS
jgi:hypothetical protein